MESVVSVIYLLLCYFFPPKGVVGMQIVARLNVLVLPVWPLAAEESQGDRA